MDELGFAGGTAWFNAVGGSPMARTLALTVIGQETPLSSQTMGAGDIAVQTGFGQVAAANGMGGRQ